MKTRIHNRLLLLVLLVSVSILLIAYNMSKLRLNRETGEENGETGRAQTEFIIWDSFSHDF